MCSRKSDPSSFGNEADIWDYTDHFYPLRHIKFSSLKMVYSKQRIIGPTQEFCWVGAFQACAQMRPDAFKCKCKCKRRIKCKCKCKCKCSASESNANANANAQQLNQMQMQMHLNQMQMHLNQMRINLYQMQTVFYKCVFCVQQVLIC